jgi:hypothetical protein
MMAWVLSFFFFAVLRFELGLMLAREALFHSNHSSTPGVVF